MNDIARIYSRIENFTSCTLSNEIVIIRSEIVLQSRFDKLWSIAVRESFIFSRQN